MSWKRKKEWDFTLAKRCIDQKQYSQKVQLTDASENWCWWNKSRRCPLAPPMKHIEKHKLFGDEFDNLKCFHSLCHGWWLPNLSGWQILFFDPEISHRYCEWKSSGFFMWQNITVGTRSIYSMILRYPYCSKAKLSHWSNYGLSPELEVRARWNLIFDWYIALDSFGRK